MIVDISKIIAEWNGPCLCYLYPDYELDTFQRVSHKEHPLAAPSRFIYYRDQILELDKDLDNPKFRGMFFVAEDLETGAQVSLSIFEITAAWPELDL